MEIFMKKHFVQGDLDALCGVYCVANVIAQLHGPFEEDDYLQLWNSLIRAIQDRKAFPRWLTEGMGCQEVQRMLKAFDGGQYPIRYRKPFYRKSKVSIGEFWASLQSFVRPNRVVILATDEHWTVVVCVDGHKLKLADSTGIKTINRNECGIGYRAIKKQYRLLPEHAFYIERVEDVGGSYVVA